MEVYLASPWIPREWVEVHGLTVRGMFCGPALCDESPPLSEGVCAFAQRTLEMALGGKDCDSAFVFASSCDQMRRSFDRLAREKSNVFLFNLPSTWQSEASLELFRLELKRLARFLEKLGGRRAADETVVDLVNNARVTRSRLRMLWEELRARDYAEAVASFHWDGRVAYGASSSWVGRGIPVALVGGPLTRGYFGILDAIESAGGRVVLNATET
ncbi:MAG: 2-hydroxyacyl-CoA dehydratase family protein, partial [Verrucomicrobiae bacterium]|nr:2-hydroxyacyl-CoA dehydratase family protein [Verrucomicrobiae bacterium]